MLLPTMIVALHVLLLGNLLNSGRRSRLAPAHVPRIQTRIADGMLLAQPGEEALEAQPIAAVG